MKWILVTIMIYTTPGGHSDATRADITTQWIPYATYNDCTAWWTAPVIKPGLTITNVCVEVAPNYEGNQPLWKPPTQ
jgi:hypothetical protein